MWDGIRVCKMENLKTLIRTETIGNFIFKNIGKREGRFCKKGIP